MQNEIVGFKVRKWIEYYEETLENENGVKSEVDPIRKYVIGAVIKNPYAGKFSQNLDLLINPSKDLGIVFGKRLTRCSNGFPILSYGKSFIIGTLGEYEHGNACLTNVFAEPLRKAIGGGIAWIPSTGKIGGPGTEIDIPLAHKNALYARSFYDTLTISINDSPKPDEILILFAAASRSRLNARLGGLEEKDIIGNDGLRWLIYLFH